MPYWLSHGRPPQDQEPVSQTLTEEQFENLPEIIYVPMPEDNDKNDHGGVAKAIETDEEGEADEEEEPGLEEDVVIKDPELGKAGAAQDSLSLVPPTTSADVPSVQQPVDPTSEGESKEQVNEVEPCPLEPLAAASTTATAIDENHANHALCVATGSPVTPMQPPPRSYTRCTECTICIDDFEPGELLVLLPRCQHAFHKDCIRPWLLERQGRCPLCKTGVLPDGDQHETDSDRSASSLNESSS